MLPASPGSAIPERHGWWGRGCLSLLGPARIMLLLKLAPPSGDPEVLGPAMHPPPGAALHHPGQAGCSVLWWGPVLQPPWHGGRSTAGVLRPHCSLSPSRCPHRLLAHEMGTLVGTGWREAAGRLCTIPAGSAGAGREQLCVGHQSQSIPLMPPLSSGVGGGVRPGPTLPGPGRRTPPGARGSRCQRSRRDGCPHGAGLRPATAQIYRWEGANGTAG